MVEGFSRKRIAVLSDHDVLSSAIELSLKSCLEIETVKLVPNATQSQVDDFDLVIVAMSSPVNGPLVALARSALAWSVGQVPLLISSDSPFRSAPDVKIFHLSFPFDLDKLCKQVREILREESQGDLSTRHERFMNDQLFSINSV